MPEVYGVFEGGGVRGSALVGAVAAAEELGLTFRAVAGTSAGAIVAALLAAGYDAAEMRTLLTETDFKTFKDPVSPLCALPGLGPLIAWQKLGFYKGDAFYEWIAQRLSEKLTGRLFGAPRFEDLRLPLKIVATDVVLKEPVVFSVQDNPKMPVAYAVRMSMSIPFFFVPVPLGESWLVDGGALSNFPAWDFNAERNSAPLPILGFRLQPDDVPPPRIKNMLDLAKALIFTMMSATTPPEVSEVAGLYQLNLPTLGVGTTDFEVAPSKKDELYTRGYSAALDFFNDPNRAPFVTSVAEPTAE